VKHKTYHFIDPDSEDSVLARCEACDWHELIDVAGLSGVEGMAKIFEVRDKHERGAERIVPTKEQRARRTRRKRDDAATT
jgi:hypothetical protein